MKSTRNSRGWNYNGNDHGHGLSASGVGAGRSNRKTTTKILFFCQRLFLKVSLATSITSRTMPTRRAQKCLLLSAVGICCYLGIQCYMAYSFAFWNPRHPNYFIDSNEFKSLGYIVKTTTCKILNLSAWDSSILSLVNASSSPIDCYKMYRHWTFVNGSNIIMNITAIEESGYSMKSIDCCYKIITRVEQSMESYDELADAVSKASKVCEPLRNEINPLTAEFVRVKCIAKYWPAFRDVVYRNYHTLAQPNRSEETLRKINYWAERSTYSSVGAGSGSGSSPPRPTSNSPPHILIIGIDSMSRLNFMRTMKKTRAFLKQIGAVELLGYTKVGENTFPNAVAMLSGYSEEELTKICYPTAYTAQDSCPYIWKRFNSAKYLTAHLEDMPGIQIFNHCKTGFVMQQVDFYLRPFMLDLFGPIYEKDCIGPDTQDQKIFNYIKSIRDLCSENNVPSFIFTWITNLAHRDLNAPLHADSSYEDFLRHLDMNNTILFFMSDHGFRYGSFRETFAGWFEDKLPNFWVYLPQYIRTKFPHWYHRLQINSARLTSPYDFYHTLNHILEEFSNIPQNEDATMLSSSNNGGVNMTFPRKIGQSFFKEVPEARKCSEAGIKNNFCPCATPRKVLLDNSNLFKAAQTAVNFINKLIPPQCSKLRVIELTAGGTLNSENSNELKSTITTVNSDSSSSSKYNNSESDTQRLTTAESYIVAFVTEPGKFLFEATVEFHRNRTATAGDNFQVSGNVLRMNKMTSDVSCVQDAEIQKMCYCSS